MEVFDILFRFYWYSSKKCNVTISTRYKRFYPEKCWGWKWCNCCTLQLSGCARQAELRWRKLPCDLLRKAQENWGNIGKTNIPIYKVIFQLFAQFENRRDVKNIFGKNRGPARSPGPDWWQLRHRSPHNSNIPWNCWFARIQSQGSQPNYPKWVKGVHKLH